MDVADRRTLTALPQQLTTPIAREYVHRRAFSEVFLTGWDRVGQDTFTVGAQWPRRHSFYTAPSELHDPLLLCETVRQALPLLSHAAYDLPFGHKLTWERFSYTVIPAFMSIGTAPTEIELRVTCSELKVRGSTPASMTMDFEILRDGLPLGSATTRFHCHSPAVYRRLRGAYGDLEYALAQALTPPPPLFPWATGRQLPQDVVLGASADALSWPLRADLSHPILFDHPVDHAPGALLLEATRQAAQAAHPLCTAYPTAMDIRFDRFVEFDSECRVEASTLTATAPDQMRVAINAVQLGRTAFTAEVTGQAVTAP
ncbi:ScbA/BarX family gamma-butyrolactone biosynthesis protein [Streptomyces sp. NPDC002790]|uniref:ScbA/BarX family gamma-butyrolactone biosynthesis protein n=1 Tax=Streptomyces sp. NPDC002790 TaxID=3154431 RepID=UPI0033236C6E